MTCRAPQATDATPTSGSHRARLVIVLWALFRPALSLFSLLALAFPARALPPSKTCATELAAHKAQLGSQPGQIESTHALNCANWRQTQHARNHLGHAIRAGGTWWTVATHAFHKLQQSQQNGAPWKDHLADAILQASPTACDRPVPANWQLS